MKFFPFDLQPPSLWHSIYFATAVNICLATLKNLVN